ncbi:MAG: glutaredoxin family protein [Steroidobacteraceae bacterium]|nr:glutaredoxin family protein [Steroidobacteraceae bacterium]
MVWSREGCGLCDELVEELAPWAAARGWALEVRDVDDDPEARRRFGLKIPVLVLDGTVVCHGRLDLPELERLVRGRP